MISERIQEELDRDDLRMRTLRGRAEILRLHATAAEIKLRNFLHSEWLFQVPLLDYIVDFFHPVDALAIEIEGKYHEYPTKKNINRDWKLFQDLGIRTIRFWSGHILFDTDKCLEEIFWFIADPHPPLPPGSPTQEELVKKQSRTQELKEIRKQVAEFEASATGLTRAEVFTLSLDQYHPEARERIQDLIRFWPDQGYVAPGIQKVTYQKLKNNLALL